MSDDTPVGRPGKFVVDSMEHYDKMGYNVSCRAGAINVILLPTQTIDDGLSFLDFKPTYEFRGTKLVPLPSQGDLRTLWPPGHASRPVSTFHDARWW